MLNLFSRYVSVGVVNTAIHWLVFGLLIHLVSMTQATANLIAFCVAVTFSFFANARWTFKTKVTYSGYIMFVLFMGFMAGLTGYLSDIMKVPPLITLVAFSAISLACGFIYSKLIVFRDAK
ncbi:GtrA family protein [Kosakonia sp. MUSA4]|uniref:GtrA family protein n=1 Tax=Kosakonia sp. MUSA4 TaxID=2067958 RepID=UPI0015979D77|nr:GtrA family protein [Kosakonia sp. MUSA4]QJT81348.1 translocase [Kosakonia sp. MUSA4]